MIFIYQGLPLSASGAVTVSRREGSPAPLDVAPEYDGRFVNERWLHGFIYVLDEKRDYVLAPDGLPVIFANAVGVPLFNCEDDVGPSDVAFSDADPRSFLHTPRPNLIAITPINFFFRSIT